MLPTRLIYGLILSAMSRICDICEKGYQRAKLVPRGVGRRVTRRTTKLQQPNLRVKRLEINGRKIKVNICASCLKRIGYEKNLLQEANA